MFLTVLTDEISQKSYFILHEEKYQYDESSQVSDIFYKLFLHLGIYYWQGKLQLPQRAMFILLLPFLFYIEPLWTVESCSQTSEGRRQVRRGAWPGSLIQLFPGKQLSQQVIQSPECSNIFFLNLSLVFIKSSYIVQWWREVAASSDW